MPVLPEGEVSRQYLEATSLHQEVSGRGAYHCSSCQGDAPRGDATDADGPS